MFGFNMLYELIFSIIFDSAMISEIAYVGLIICMPSLVVVPVSNRIKHYWTITALKRLLTSVNSLMN